MTRFRLPFASGGGGLFISGILSALLAQVLFDIGKPEGLAFLKPLLPEPTRVWIGAGLLVLSIIYWVLALRFEPLKISKRKKGKLRVSWWGLFPAFWISLGALVIYATVGESVWVRLLWAGSLVVFLIGVAYPIRLKTGGIKRLSLRSCGYAGVAVLILIAAAYMRFESIGTLPDLFHGDNGSWGIQAREFLSGTNTNIFGTGWAEVPKMGFLPAVVSMKVVGDNVQGLMIAYAVEGMLSLLALYWLARLLFKKESFALIALAVSAGSIVHIHFSRTAAGDMDPWPFCLGALCFLIDGLKNRRIFSFAVSGILLGFGIQMYSAGRIMPFIFAFILAYTYFIKKDWWYGRLNGWMLVAAGTLLTVGPNLVFFAKHAEAFNARGREVWLFSERVMAHSLNKWDMTSQWAVLLRQIKLSLLTFNYTMDSSTNFGNPHAMFPSMLAPFVILGLAVALRRWKEPGPFIALVFFWLTLILGCILTVDAPSWPRILGILVPCSIFVALAFQVICEAARYKPFLWAIVPALVVGILVWAAFSSYNTYKQEFSANSDTAALVGRYTATLPENMTVCAVAGWEPRTWQFFAYPRRALDVRNGERPLECLRPPFVWLASPDRTSAIPSGLYPNGVWEKHWRRDQVFYSFTVVKEK